MNNTPVNNSSNKTADKKAIDIISTLPDYTLGEELVNAISHGLGAVFGIVALVLCIVKSAVSGNAIAVVSSCLYGTMLVLLYTMSTIYHALKRNKAKHIFRIFDHCTIFLLIAGTYIPIILVAIGGALGWVYFGIVTGAAVIGIVLNAISVDRFEIFSMICYITMGWVIVFAFRPLANAVDRQGIALLIAGGIVYTVGAILYGIGDKRKYLHSIWHFFVLGGSILHFLMIYQYVL